MAEQIESHASEPETAATSPARRVRHRKTPARSSRAVAPTKPAATASVARSTAPTGVKRVVKPLRSLVILSMVGGLVATVAIPAFASGSLPTTDAPMTSHQIAVDDAQSFVAASDATSAQLSRESYSATTAEEIEKKKAEEAAAERARQVAAQLAAASSSTSVPTNIALTSPGSGEGSLIAGGAGFPFMRFWSARSMSSFALE